MTWNGPTMIRFLLASTMILACVTEGSAQVFDIVIDNGRVIDPETGLAAIRNVAVDGDRIVTISEFPLQGKTRIDATGKVISAGFIDLHTHGQSLPDHRMQAMQGLTTLLELESGVLPIDDWYDDQATRHLLLNYGASAAWTFGRIAAFFGGQPEATAASFQDAQGRDDWKVEIAGKERLQRILTLLEEGLKQGTIGIGVNAGYAPGYGQKEYFELAKLARKYNVATFTHVRYASNLEPRGSLEAIKELIANAALTGTHMPICHINSASLLDIEATLDLYERARRIGC